MKYIQFIKPLLALLSLLIGSSALASIYSSYSPLVVQPKPLLIIVVIASILGFLAFYQKNFTKQTV